MVNEKILEEYNTVKNNVGLFDFSIEGKIIIKGEGRIDFINGIFKYIKIIPLNLFFSYNFLWTTCMIIFFSR